MNRLFNPNKLLLQELKDIAYATPRPLRWAMVWFLLWIEPQYVDYKAKKAVDDAVESTTSYVISVKNGVMNRV